MFCNKYIYKSMLLLTSSQTLSSVRSTYPGGYLGRGGGGKLVISLRGVNFRFWSYLGCAGKTLIIFSPKGLF